MSIVNYRSKEICLKVVYVGPAMSGKTTTMRALHGLMAEDRRTEMKSIETAGDRTIFFDYFAAEIPKLHGFSVKVMVYGVPGQPMYASTRRAVMMGADAVVFVADSCVGCMDDNVRSMAETLRTIEELDLGRTRIVLQFNKRDLAVKMPAESMITGLINERVESSWESVALDGRGVAEPFRDACASAIKQLAYMVGDEFGIG